MHIHETKDEYWFPNGHITVGRHIIIEGVSDDMIKLAHLLEAAPDLLEALKTLVTNGSRQGWDDNYAYDMDKARAALAKAEGENHG